MLHNDGLTQIHKLLIQEYAHFGIVAILNGYCISIDLGG